MHFIDYILTEVINFYNFWKMVGNFFSFKSMFF